MRDRMPTLVALLALAVPAALAAQDHEHAAGNPYADLVREPPVALSGEDLEGLRAGEGMGYALAAELNGVPGPRHVLELAEPLGLDAGTVAAVTSVRERMSRRAADLGRALIEAELRLDAFFTGGGSDAAELARLVREAAALEGRLRAAHLRAHLETTELLTPEQVRHYSALRGYAEHDGAHPIG
ncbi:MAG: hypothetical protein R3266_15730 [Gemmatimonadota bacterium]|nr:hypothetical protein [Gemmatimonadota bacterium]